MEKTPIAELARECGQPALSVELAQSAADVLAVQRLRYEVFAGEMGARLSGATPGLDSDRFDDFCDHLLVRETATRRVVGTYRMLPAVRAQLTGGFYCAGEFDIGRLTALGEHVVEIGRGCVHPDYRSGLAISLLWSGLFRYILRGGFTHAIGCASVETRDGGHIAASVCRRLLQRFLAAPEWRVFPRRAFALEGWQDIPDAPVPPLLKGYLRLGARVCGDPAWDSDFKTADLLVILPIEGMNPRYVDRLLRGA